MVESVIKRGESGVREHMRQDGEKTGHVEYSKSHEDMDDRPEERKQAEGTVEGATKIVWTGTYEGFNSLIWSLEVAEKHISLGLSEMEEEGDIPGRILNEARTAGSYIRRVRDALTRNMQDEPEKLLSETVDEEHRWRDFKSQIADQVIAVLDYRESEPEIDPPLKAMKSMIRTIITGCEMTEFDKRLMNSIMSFTGIKGYANGCSYPKNEATLNEEQG